MTTLEKKLPAIFYKSLSGKEPVREWILELVNEDKKTVGQDIGTLEYCWPVGQPKCKSIKGQKGLWEIRSNISDRRIARILFFVHDGYMVLLHGFIKKTQKTPDKDLNLVISRMKEIKDNG